MDEKPGVLIERAVYDALQMYRNHYGKDPVLITLSYTDYKTMVREGDNRYVWFNVNPAVVSNDMFYMGVCIHPEKKQKVGEIVVHMHEPVSPELGAREYKGILAQYQDADWIGMAKKARQAEEEVLRILHHVNNRAAEHERREG